MTYCQHCGSQLDDNSSFCSNCGAKIETFVNPQQYQNQNVDYNQNSNSELPIIALVLAFFFPFIGLIIGIYANNKAKEATGQSNPIARAAIIVSAVILILSFFTVILYFAVFAAFIAAV